MGEKEHTAMPENGRSLSEYLDDAAPTRLKEWVWNLTAWEKPTLVAAACAAARRAYPVLTAHRDPQIECSFADPSTLAGLQAAESWLADPCAETLSAARSAAAAADRNLLSIMDNVEEASGSFELLRARERAVAAAAACVMAAEAAAWTPEDVSGLPEDELEVDARRRAGPVYQASQAAVQACYALDSTDAEFVRILAADIRRIFLKWPPSQE
jgi:hypothetical protein